MLIFSYNAERPSVQLGFSDGTRDMRGSKTMVATLNRAQLPYCVPFVFFVQFQSSA